MPFDPSLPLDHSPIVAAELRTQLTGLSEEIDALQDGTATNPSAVDLLSLTISNPPTTAQVQAIADKLDELIATLRH
jgi:hypothetical protein